MGEKERARLKRGKAYEREIGHLISKIFDKKYNKDVMRTPRSGAFSQFPGDLCFFFTTILKDYAHECKHEKRLIIKEHIKECLSKYTKWILYFKYDYYGNFSLMPTDDLLDLLKTIDDQDKKINELLLELAKAKKLEVKIFKKMEKRWTQSLVMQLNFWKYNIGN